ncbi:hypothetical protein TPHA_0I00100 [Tetrapisispora phaffii CBS 4417]|uniref:Uncharacterized protein n=1 Tax=Tetrapisispora phaffii (strain ATCC 24235 / CBS 4417 / NBRC 1672 / NRRL Y-8282 / UCD 70-5) TaxID=1071381 RepID=G8BX89_TETPH|nr:hypothetical protein TPHA_0I00100 [Tetrapisispora phaffii CBS 4417]CCE64517.1 hypothetical protein TPHA_0I00100 [Tetrapisispora phaffii CBS 4417]
MTKLPTTYLFTSGRITLLLSLVLIFAFTDAIPIIKRSFKEVICGSGATIFIGAAAGSAKITGVVCTPEAQVAIGALTFGEGGAVACLGWFATSLVLAAAGAAFAAYGTSDWNWEWEKTGVAISTRDSNIVSYTNTSNGQIITKDTYLEDFFQEALMKREIVDWDLIQYYYITPYSIVSNASVPLAIDFTKNGNYVPVTYSYMHSNGTMITTLTSKNDIASQHEIFVAWINDSQLLKRDETATWWSYNTYGANPGRCNDLEQHLNTYSSDYKQDWEQIGMAIASIDNNNIPSKFCLSASDGDTTVRENSAIVGEIYANQYGGIDGTC